MENRHSANVSEIRARVLLDALTATGSFIYSQPRYTLATVQRKKKSSTLKSCNLKRQSVFNPLSALLTNYIGIQNSSLSSNRKNGWYTEECIAAAQRKKYLLGKKSVDKQGTKNEQIWRFTYDFKARALYEGRRYFF